MKFGHDPEENGLFPAVPDPENIDMSSYWIRDNYWVYRAGYNKEEIGKAFREIVRKHEGKIRDAIKSPPEEEWQHIHPRYDSELEEADGEWAWIQHDSVANLLEVMVEEGHDYEANLLLKYLESVDPIMLKGYGPWEDEKKSHAYSLASVARALRGAGKISQAYDFRHEAAEIIRDEEVELAQLMAALQLNREDLAEETAKEIEDEGYVGDYGVIRYEGDKWTGDTFDDIMAEPEWCFGLYYMYKATEDDKYLKRMKKIVDEFGEVPESFVDGAPNNNSPLIWAEALFAEAIDSE